MKVSRVQAFGLTLICLSLFACNAQKPQEPITKVTVTTPQSKAVTLTQPYVCRINAHHHIDIRAPEAGYLVATKIHEGQTVERDELIYQLRPLRDKEKLDPENKDKVLSIVAPFDGTIGRLPQQHGSLVKRGQTLTTLSDNAHMWVYFNVPEARFLEYDSETLAQHAQDLKIELVLANGKKFNQQGQLGAIGADFNSETGNIPFRADFPNPDRLLRHGQSGTVLISRVQKDAIVIPQAATFEDLGGRYVYLVDQDNVVHRREIVIQNELDGQFIIKSGVDVNDKIVLDEIHHLREGDKVEYQDPHQQQVVASRK